MNKFCSNCGDKLGDGDAFCGGCGARVTQPPQAIASPSGGIMPPPAAPAVSAAAPSYAAQQPPQEERPTAAVAPPPQVGVPPPAKSKAGAVLGFVSFAVAFVVIAAVRTAVRDHMRTADFESAPSSYASPTNPISSNAGSAPQGTTLHMYRPGDRWTYKVTLILDTPNGDSIGGKGTAQEDIGSTTLNGVTVLTDTMEGQVALDNGRSFDNTTVDYFRQDADGSYVLLADQPSSNAPIRYLNSPVTLWPGQWSGNSSYQVNLVYSNGDTSTRTISLQGPESSPDLTGKLQTAWQTHSVIKNSDGSTATEPSELCPSIGQALDDVEDLTTADGNKIHTETVLTGYYPSES